MRIEEDLKLDFKDVLIRPRYSTLNSRMEVDLSREFHFVRSKQSWCGIPIIASNMDHTGTFKVAEALGIHKLMTAINKFVTEAEWKQWITKHPELCEQIFVTAGSGENDFANLRNIMAISALKFICLDIANGYSQHFIETIRRTRYAFPQAVIMAGNVVTGEMTEKLLLAGADIVKVGIGPGSVCITRKKTGVGYPQLSAIIECADAAHGLNGYICADGGCTVPGDIAKAFGAGADFVMLGGMFAGHDECAGEVFERNGEKCKRFYGMSSGEAMNKYFGEVATYRASEGKSVNLPYRGPIAETLLDLLGGLRSACAYVGARKLAELIKRTTFVRVTQQLNEIFTVLEV